MEEPRRVSPLNRSDTKHFVDVLNRKTAAGTRIPDDAAIFSTGEIVRVKGEAFRIRSLDKKRLVLEGVKEADRESAKLAVETLIHPSFGPASPGMLLGSEDPTELDRYDVDQRLTVEGTEYAVTGKALILAPIDPPPSEAEPPQSPAPTAPEDHSTAEPSTKP